MTPLIPLALLSASPLAPSECAAMQAGAGATEGEKAIDDIGQPIPPPKPDADAAVMLMNDFKEGHEALLSGDCERAVALFERVSLAAYRGTDIGAQFYALSSGTRLGLTLNQADNEAEERGEFKLAAAYTAINSSLYLREIIRYPIPIDPIGYANDIVSSFGRLAALDGDDREFEYWLNSAASASSPDRERGIADELLLDARTIRNYAPGKRERLDPFLPTIIAFFERTGRRAPDALAAMKTLYADFLIATGRAHEAGAFLSESSTGQTPKNPRDIALMFASGHGNEAIAIIRQELSMDGSQSPLGLASRLIQARLVPGLSADTRIAIQRAVIAATERDSLKVHSDHGMLVDLLIEAGRPVQAEDAALTLWRLTESAKLNPAFRQIYRGKLALAIEAQGRWDEATAIYISLSNDPDEDIDERARALSLPLQDLLKHLLRKGRSSEAERLAQQALDTIGTDIGADENRVASLNIISAEALLQLGRPAEAEGRTMAALRIRPSLADENSGPSQDRIVAKTLLASAYEAQNRYGDATPLRRSILAETEESEDFGFEKSAYQSARLALAINLADRALGQSTEATELFGGQLKMVQGIYGQTSPQTIAVAVPYARYYLFAGEAERALPIARIALAAQTGEQAKLDSTASERDRKGRAAARQQAVWMVVQSAWQIAKPEGPEER